MSFNVNQFRGQLTGDGARPNLFEVRLNFPSFVEGNSIARLKAPFMVKSAQLPGSTVGVAPVNYFGREVKLAGNRTFSDWSVSVINDEDFAVRNALESWFRGLNDNEGNVRSTRAVSSLQYGVDAVVTQFSKDGKAIKKYKMVGLFPNDLGAIDLDWGSNDTVEEYSVNFSLQYWVPEGSNSVVGSFIRSAIDAIF